MKITFNEKASLDTLILFLGEEFTLENNPQIDTQLKSTIKQIIDFKKFEGKAGQTCSALITGHPEIKYLKLIGAGDLKKASETSLMKLGGKIVSSLKCSKIDQASVLFDSRNNIEHFNAFLAYGSTLKNYSFDKYKSSEKLKDKTNILHLEFISNLATNEGLFFAQELKPVAEAIYFSRNLISEPPNVIYPESFAKTAQELMPSNVQIEILGEQEMRKLGMNALLGVAQGSSKEAKLLVMQYHGGNANDQPLAFVGKGVTFDTGGISLKPSANMEDMKYDMSGAAIVTGLIMALAKRKAKVNIVAIAGLVENMPDGNAQRPADVVKSMSGQTIEVINTDAEGRLVLSDALWYCQDRFKPKLMIDLATLTGAIVVSLGTYQAGLFSNDLELERTLIQAGKATDEKLWPFPLSDDYDKMIDSPIADVRNLGNGKGAGSITAAQFLKRFVNNVPWAHLDIAGVSWAEKDSELHPTGATGFGLRLLNQFIKDYEK